MTLRRFHSNDLQNTTVDLDRDQARHAIKALRLTQNQTVELFDGQGASAIGSLQISGQNASVLITSRHQTPPPNPTVHLAIALPKGPRAAAMIETLSELGADRVTPLITTNTVVNPRDKKIDKLQRVALESAKQCKRDWTLQIDPPAQFDTFINDTATSGAFTAEAPALKLIADTNNPEDQHNIHDQLQAIHGNADSTATPTSGVGVLVLIGPEGGWTDPERATAHTANFLPWSLGPHTMRIATAAAAATALLRQIR